MKTSTPFQRKTVHHSPLTQSSFSSFGTVIENPFPTITNPILPPPQTPEPSYQPTTMLANQNTALKLIDVSPLSNRYARAPSGIPGTPVMSMFVCFPRALIAGDEVGQLFPISVLERHPFTTQTFIPLGLSVMDPSTSYLVIVAPTLSSTGGGSGKSDGPDLENLRVFLAHGGQAVTYAAGTWHAPMAVIGRRRVDFVVVQNRNGVVREDCEEVELEGKGILVLVRLESGEDENGGSELGRDFSHTT